MKKNAPTRFLIALVVGVFFGSVLGLLGKGLLQEQGGASTAEIEEEAIQSALRHRPGFGYAQALMEGRWEAAVDQTLWMRERLDQVALRNADPQALEEERAQLVTLLSDRSVTGNYLRAEGIEDQYVFVPGVVLKALERDAGHSHLAAPVAERLWIEVRFPDRNRAVRDETGLPIRIMRVGVNVTEAGLVLKANVIGNLEIDRESLSYDWR